uniref:Uncharacterized protein n=1 Tax=Anguilla anguilla TaxID=7936 RepID=A0A0E9WD48_ANGAN
MASSMISPRRTMSCFSPSILLSAACTASRYLKCSSISLSTFSQSFSVNLLRSRDLCWAFRFLSIEAMMEQTCSSCSLSDTPAFLIFLGVFMNSGKMVLKPRMSTNLWQLSEPSGPIMPWSRTLSALMRDIFFSLSMRFIS